MIPQYSNRGDTGQLYEGHQVTQEAPPPSYMMPSVQPLSQPQQQQQPMPQPPAAYQQQPHIVYNPAPINVAVRPQRPSEEARINASNPQIQYISRPVCFVCIYYTDKYSF